MGRYLVAITGASGVIYGVRLVNWLLTNDHEVHLIISEPGHLVLKDEMGWDLEEVEDIRPFFDSGNLVIHNIRNIAAVVASGSFHHDGMVIIPCTMSTLAGVANGLSTNLIERAADVSLKEGYPLVLVPRETPLNIIHLRNLLAAAEAGARIVPAMPGFYSHPSTIEEMVNFLVGKVLDSLGLKNDIFPRYQSHE